MEPGEVVVENLTVGRKMNTTLFAPSGVSAVMTEALAFVFGPTRTFPCETFRCKVPARVEVPKTNKLDGEENALVVATTRELVELV